MVAGTVVVMIGVDAVRHVRVPKQWLLAVAALEPTTRRARAAVFTAIGAVVSVVLMYSLLRGPVTAAVNGHHIEYTVDLRFGGLIVVLYVVATCGSLLMSHHLYVKWFGVVNLVAVAALAWIDRTALISLWCGWAAVTSVCIALHLRRHPTGAFALARA